MAFMRSLARWMEKNLERPFTEIELNRAEPNCAKKANNEQSNRNIKSAKIIPLKAAK